MVDHNGHVIAHPDTQQFVPGADLRASSYIVAQVPPCRRICAPPKPSSASPPVENGHKAEMIGTYSTIPDLGWAVVAQRSLEKAREDAGVNELNSQALTFVLVVTFAALILGYLFAVGISTPIRSLAGFHPRHQPRRISRAHAGARRRGNQRAGRNLQQHGRRYRKLHRPTEAAAEENRELFLGSIRMLAAAIDEKDPYTRGHSDRVARYSMLIGEAVGPAGRGSGPLRIAALLHDVGKIGVDDRVLKKPGALTPEEFEMMKQHPSKGANIMRPVAQLKDMLPGIELHHEHVDGNGYPYGLKGDEIPLMARIIAVADTLDAMTTNRPYQSAHGTRRGPAVIRKVTGTKFDIARRGCPGPCHRPDSCVPRTTLVDA